MCLLDRELVKLSPKAHLNTIRERFNCFCTFIWYKYEKISGYYVLKNLYTWTQRHNKNITR